VAGHPRRGRAAGRPRAEDLLIASAMTRAEPPASHNAPAEDEEVADEVKLRRVRMRLSVVHDRPSLRIEDTEMTDQRLEPGREAGRAITTSGCTTEPSASTTPSSRKASTQGTTSWPVVRNASPARRSDAGGPARYVRG